MNKKLFTIKESCDKDSHSCKCPSSEEHTCPYSEEINNDSTSTCNCCKECTFQCSMDI